MKEYFKNLFDTKNNLVAPGIFIAVAIVLFAFILQIVAGKIANKDQSITVTGTTEREVKADTAKWTLSVSERAYGDGAGLSASRIASKSIDTVKAYLIKNGIQENQITVQTSNLSPICELSPQGYENCSVGVKGQIANQNLVVDSGDVDKVKDLSGRAAIEITGINLNNNYVEYYYNKLKDIRVDMLAEATKNARERADAVAKAGGARVGNITSLSSGVFQVTQKNSVNVDDYGAYDTTSIDKKITATVKVNFSVR
jgi:hypothetical protein